MRPPDVRHRVPELIAAHWQEVLARQEWRLRVELDTLIRLCGRLYYSDVSMVAVLQAYREVLGRLSDPEQRRTGSFAERLSLEVLEAIRGEIGDLDGISVETLSLDEYDRLRVPLVRIPPLMILGMDDPASHFHLVCWSAVNSLVEGFKTPYLTARAIANMGFHKPHDPYRIAGPMDELAVRYEDGPADRQRTALEIRAEIDDYRRRVPSSWSLALPE